MYELVVVVRERQSLRLPEVDVISLALTLLGAGEFRPGASKAAHSRLIQIVLILFQADDPNPDFSEGFTKL
jgi:hypothetical protein